MMPLKIFSDKSLPREEWSYLTNNSIYVSPEFVSIWKTKNGRAVFFADESNGKLRAGMAGVIFGKRFLKRFQSMPDSLNGGPFYIPGYDSKRKSEFIEAVFNRLKSLNIIRADITNPGEKITSPVFKEFRMSTHVIQLEGDSYQPPSRKVRGDVRAGKSRGAVVRVFDDPEYLEASYQLSCQTGKRFNRKKPEFPPLFFERLFEISKKDDRILWLMALDNNRLIGSKVCLIDRGRIFLWLYYSDYESRHLKTDYLLNDAIIKYALKNKLTCLNFGWSPPDAKNLIAYKERWGGVPDTIPYYTYFSSIGKMIYRWRSG